MKKIPCLLLCLFALNAAKAGDDDKSTEKKRKLIFTASIGANIALGDYGSKKPPPANDTSHMYGYADGGLYFDLSAGYKITEGFGLMAMLTGNIDNFNTVTFQDAYAYNTMNPNPLSENEVNTSGSYFLVQYLVGPFFEIPYSKNKLSKICVKILVGSMHCNYPTISSADGYSQSVASGSGFAYRLCVGYEPYVYGGVRLSINLGYGGGIITYPSVTTNIPGSTIYGTQPETYTSNTPRTMSIGLIQISTGVIVEL